MKKVLLLMSLFMLSTLTMLAQKDVTKFLGIPVDGYKADMKKKLTAKGFTYDSQHDFFKGEFNGHDVRVYIGTNNNKVWRIMVCDVNTYNGTDIKIRFNNLCRQFSKNKNYITASLLGVDYTIPESEDISYEMLVNKKRYEASYFQDIDPSLIDSLAIKVKVRESLLRVYTQEEIENPSDEKREEMERFAQ